MNFLTKIHVRLCKARASGRGTVPEPDLAERHAVGLVELEGLAHSREGVRRLAEYHLCLPRCIMFRKFDPGIFGENLRRHVPPDFSGAQVSCGSMRLCNASVGNNEAYKKSVCTVDASEIHPRC